MGAKRRRLYPPVRSRRQKLRGAVNFRAFQSFSKKVLNESLSPPDKSLVQSISLERQGSLQPLKQTS
jgi:hypothetical protein